MAKRYNYSRSYGDCRYEIEGCDSFDEAEKIINKAIYDRQLADKGTQQPLPEVPKQEGGPVHVPFVPSVPNTTAGNFPPTGK